MTASMDQLEHVLQLLEEDRHRQWPEEFLRELLGSEWFGRYLGEKEWLISKVSDEAITLQQSMPRPRDVERYLEALSSKYKLDKSQGAMIQRLNKRILALQIRADSLEKQIAERPAALWRKYDSLGQDQAWCGAPPETRAEANHPKVYSEAPWPVLFPDRMPPRNVALESVIKKVLEE